MKHIAILSIGLLVFGCTTTQLVAYWKNPNIDTYKAYKILVVGMTANTEARQKFEQQLKDEYESRGVEAVMSLNFLDPNVKVEKMTNAALNLLENNLINEGFDTVLFTKIIGVEDKIAYKKNYNGYDATHRKFKEDFLKYQDIFYNPEYYEEYTVYHAETSMYCICPTKERELIWKGYVDITDPQFINETVNDYIRLIIVVLEEQQLINPKIHEEVGDLEEAI